MQAVELPTRVHSADEHCGSIFHIECLADAFAKGPFEEKEDAPLVSVTEPVLLPVTGKCPTCGPAAKVGPWSDVVRGVFRRADRMREELANQEKEAALREKRRQKEEERQAAIAAKKAEKEAARQAKADAKAQDKAGKAPVAARKRKVPGAAPPAGFISDSDSGDNEQQPAAEKPAAAHRRADGRLKLAAGTLKSIVPAQQAQDKSGLAPRTGLATAVPLGQNSSLHL